MRARFTLLLSDFTLSACSAGGRHLTSLALAGFYRDIGEDGATKSRDNNVCQLHDLRIDNLTSLNFVR